MTPMDRAVTSASWAFLAAALARSASASRAFAAPSRSSLTRAFQA